MMCKFLKWFVGTDSIECMSWSSSACICFTWLPNLCASNFQVVSLHRWPGMSHQGTWGEENYNSKFISGMTHPVSHTGLNLKKKKKPTKKWLLDQLEYPPITDRTNLIRICYELNTWLMVRKYYNLIFLHKKFLTPYFCAVFFSCFTKYMQETLY